MGSRLLTRRSFSRAFICSWIFSGRASFTFYLRGAYRSFAVYRTYFCSIGSALEITLWTFIAHSVVGHCMCIFRDRDCIFISPYSFTSGCEFGTLGWCFSTHSRGVVGSHDHCSSADETSRGTCDPNFILSAVYRIFSVIACGFFYGTSDDTLVCIILYKFAFPYRCRVICQLSDLVLAVEKIFGVPVGCLFFFDPNLRDVFWCGVTQWTVGTQLFGRYMLCVDGCDGGEFASQN